MIIKYSVHLVSLLLLTGNLFAQKKPANSDLSISQQLEVVSDSIKQFQKRKHEELRKDSTFTVNNDIVPRFFSKDAFDKYFDEYFTLLNYQKQSFTDGNSAAINITENDTRLNLTLSKKANASIFSIGTIVSVKDKSGTIFSNNSPTSGTQFNVSHTFLLPFSTLSFTVNDRRKNYQSRIDVLDSTYLTHVLKNPNVYSIQKAKLEVSDLEISRLENKLDSLEKKLDRLEKKSDSLKLLPSNHFNDSLIHFNDSLIHFNDSLITTSKQRLVVVIEDNVKATKELSVIEPAKPVNEYVKDIEENVECVMTKKQLANKAVTFFKLQWISYGFSYKREVYGTYDSLLLFARRVDSKPFNVWSFSATYNFLWEKTPEWRAKSRGIFNSTYVGINYTLGTSNNYADLDDTNISLQTIHSNASDSTYLISTDKKLKDITRKPFNSYVKQTIGLQFTGMFGKSEFVGINIIASLDNKNSVTTQNLRTGLLFRFKNSSDVKTFVNFEIFLNMKDLDNQKRSVDSTWKRKEIGISAVIPFEKVFFR